MATQINRAVNAKPRESRAWLDANVLRLVNAVRQLHATEQCVGASTYRQSSEMRLIVLHTAEKVHEILSRGGIR